MELKKVKNFRKKIDSFFDKKYDESYPKLKIIPVFIDEELEDNKYHINRFKVKYPFYKSIMKIIRDEPDGMVVKSKIIKKITDYLIVLNNNGTISVKGEDYKIIYKKNYLEEKKNLSNDLNMMLYEALLNNKIKQIYESDKIITKENSNFEPKKLDKKPGRKLFSENNLVALKYHIIQKFYTTHSPLNPNSKFKSIGDFQTEISKVENVNPNSFKNSFNKIAKEDLEKFCKDHPELINQLIKLKSFKDFPKCKTFLDQLTIK